MSGYFAGRNRFAGALCAALSLAVLMIAVPAHASTKTVWLCNADQPADPCAPGLSTTVYSPKLKPLSVEHPTRVKHPGIDCFYVYPTVSDQKTTNANLHIDPVERSIVLYQAARYSQYCRLFAPMYRQLTLSAILKTPGPTKAQAALPLQDVRAAFQTYLRKYNHGRGFVLIGHSQGSFVLRQLIARDVDPKPAVRKLLVSAILLGGNVLVKKGSGIGGDFKHIRACTSESQIGCVIAFSTFDAAPPANALFGRTTMAGMQVLCTNPQALTGGVLDPIFPSRPFYPKSTLSVGIKLLGLTQPMPHTVWSSEPGSYTAHCSSAAGASVLEIQARGGAKTPHPSPTAGWGLHLLDANIALGNLVAVVNSEAAAFAASGR